MDFAFSDEQTAFRLEFRDWLEDTLPAGWLDGERDLPSDRDDREAFLRDWLATLYDGGWAGIGWPAEYGGRDASLVEQVIYNQELARVDAPLLINRVGILFVGPTLMELGTEAQKAQFLPKMLTGEHVWFQAYSEPNAGSDLANVQTKAVRDGDRFRITGQKLWASYAHYADWAFLLARTDDSGPNHHGITALLVPVDQPGVTVEPIRQIPDTRDFNQVFFDDAIAEAEHVVGDVDDGWSAAMTLLSFEHGLSRLYQPDRLSLEGRLEELVEYCQTHTRDGAPLSDDPEIRRRLAAFHARLQAAQATHLRYVDEHMTAGDAGRKGSMDRVFSNELYQDMEAFGMELLGAAAGLADGFEDGRWPERYLESLGATIAGGTSDIHRNIIAERVLGLPKDLPSGAE